MTSYAVLKISPRVEALVRQLEARGAVPAPSAAQADVVLAAADTVAQAAQAMTAAGAAAGKTLLVGDLPSIAMTTRPGTLEWILENLRPLGVLRWDDTRPWDPGAPNFIGSKEHAGQLQAGYMKAIATFDYAAWIRTEGEDAADFILRLLAAAAHAPTGSPPDPS